MQEKIKIANDLVFTSSLKMLTEAYEEISVIKMQRIRSSVLKTREFLSELSSVFYDVKTSYVKKITALMKAKKIKNTAQFSTLPKNGKSVCLLISANDKLYGDIVPRTFRLFLDEINTTDTDIVIIGKLGKDLFEERQIKKKYTYFEMNDAKVSIEELKPIISHILAYEKVTVYYGKFVNVITQSPTSLNISGEQPIEADTGKHSKYKFIFEPDVEEMLNFFETQIFTSLFKQTIHESQLARYASRIMAMERAIGHVDTRLKELQNSEKRVKRLMVNRKQLAALSGISIWRRV